MVRVCIGVYISRSRGYDQLSHAADPSLIHFVDRYVDIYVPDIIPIHSSRAYDIYIYAGIYIIYIYTVLFEPMRPISKNRYR